MYIEQTRNGKTRGVHDIIMEELLGRPLEKNEVVHHINGDKQDNRPENLQVLTRAEHTRLHATGRKLSPEARQKMSAYRRGSTNPSARHLTAEQVEDIVRGLAEGKSSRKLAEEYAVSKTAIDSIRKGKTYKDVLAELPTELFAQIKRKETSTDQQRKRSLSPEDVTAVRLALLEGQAVSSIAEEFGISGGTVACIRDGETYRDIPSPVKIGELSLMRDMHRLADRMLASPAPSDGEDRHVLLNEYGLYPTYEAVLMLRLLRRALDGNKESIFMLYALSSYDEEIYKAVGETSALIHIAGTDEIIISMICGGF